MTRKSHGKPWASFFYLYYEFRLKKALNGLLYIAVVIPELVIGLASLASFTKMGFDMGFNTLVFAHVTFCLPFVIITLRARIADFDNSIEEAAMDLGATCGPLP